MQKQTDFTNEKCIHLILGCAGHTQFGLILTVILFSGPPCGSHQFSCGGGCCVDMVDKCDGHKDCPNSDLDEAASVCSKF